jgi:hypothetical protein
VDGPCKPSFPTDLGELLIERLGLEEVELPDPPPWSGGGNTVGSLALRLGLMTLDQVEQVIDLQASDESYFGDLSVKLGYLRQDQLDCILLLQRVHRLLDFGGLLVAERRLAVPTLLELLGELHARKAEGGG